MERAPPPIPTETSQHSESEIAQHSVQRWISRAIRSVGYDVLRNPAPDLCCLATYRRRSAQTRPFYGVGCAAKSRHFLDLARRPSPLSVVLARPCSCEIATDLVLFSTRRRFGHHTTTPTRWNYRSRLRDHR